MSFFMVNLLEMIQLSSWNKLKVAQGYTFHFAVMSMFLPCVRVAEPWKHFWKAVVMKRTLMELGAWFVLFIYFVYFEKKLSHTLVILIKVFRSTCFFLEKATGRSKRVGFYGTRVGMVLWYYGAGKVLK